MAVKTASLRSVQDLNEFQLNKLRSAAKQYRLRPDSDLEQKWLLKTIEMLRLEPEEAIDWALAV